MKQLSHILLTVILVCMGCSDKTAHYLMPSAPDYGEENAWYKELNAPQGDNNSTADVFYIAPTCVWDWHDSQGNTMHFEDVYNADQREALRPSLELAADIFATTNNFYAPYYRQITLESWMEGEDTVEKRFPYAMSDVKRAFDHYLEHDNGGRPFILAGFSQGAKAVVELLKDMPADVHSRMVAAYVIGYNVSERTASYFKTIQAARDSIDTGVTVCYNSVESPECANPGLSPSEICINPVNWRCDSEPATVQDTVSVSVDTAHKLLIVKGLDSDKYYHPSLGNLFVKGNYHLLELELYKDSLKENVRQRIENLPKTCR